MTKEKTAKDGKYAHSGGAIYGLGFLGAAYYYLQHASSFQSGAMGIVKAIFWPALFVYKAIGLLGL